MWNRIAMAVTLLVFTCIMPVPAIATLIYWEWQWALIPLQIVAWGVYAVSSGFVIWASNEIAEMDADSAQIRHAV